VKSPAGDRRSEPDSTNPPPDWAALFARLADSLSRVVRAEILLLEKRLTDNASAAIGNVVTRAAAILVLAASTVVGLICLLGGYILLLHRWLPAWQACGIGGLTIIVIGFIIFTLFSASARRGG
jgi:hypothetical protein